MFSMKQFLLLMVTLCFSCFSAIAQSEIEFGVTTEGSLLIFGDIPHYSQQKKKSLGVGIGVYASRNIAGKLSADLGVMYRYKLLKEYYDISPNTGGYGGYSPYGYGYSYGSQSDYPDLGMIKGWKSYSLNYIVVPFHLNYLVYKKKSYVAVSRPVG